jgi:peptide/nickel transport system permease protein
MTEYFARRFGVALLTAIGAAFLVFSTVRMLPGDTVDVLLQSGGYADVKTRDDLAKALGIDRPLLVQFGSWAKDLVQGDFGNSLITKRPIGTDLSSALPVTLELGLLSVFFATIIGVPIGVFSAVRQNTFLDYGARTFSVFFLSVPGFLIGTAVIVFGSKWFNWSPALEYKSLFEDPIANLRQFWVPSLLLGLGGSAGLMRFTRTAVLEIIRQDYIRTARSKGLSETTTIWRHILRNSMLPVITVIGIYLAYIIGGSIIFERMFALPGLGRYFFNAVAKRDYPSIQAVGLIYAVFVILVNLITDLMYVVVDPRIRYGK